MNCSSSNLMNFILAFTELPHSSRSDCGMWIKIGCLWASIDECEECFRLHHFILRALELNVHNNYKFGVINWCHGNWKHWWQCRYYFYNYDIFPVAYKLLKNSAWQRINKSHGEWHLSPCFVPSGPGDISLLYENYTLHRRPSSENQKVDVFLCDVENWIIHLILQAFIKSKSEVKRVCLRHPWGSEEQWKFDTTTFLWIKLRWHAIYAPTVREWTASVCIQI